jgi:hypothetical protein
MAPVRRSRSVGVVACGTAAGGARYGMIIWVPARSYEKAAKTLGVCRFLLLRYEARS